MVLLRNVRDGRFARRDARKEQQLEIYSRPGKLLRTVRGRLKQKEIAVIIKEVFSPKGDETRDAIETAYFAIEGVTDAEVVRLAQTDLFKITFYRNGVRYENVVEKFGSEPMHVVARGANAVANTIAEAEAEMEEEETAEEVEAIYTATQRRKKAKKAAQKNKNLQKRKATTTKAKAGKPKASKRRRSSQHRKAHVARTHKAKRRRASSRARRRRSSHPRWRSAGHPKAARHNRAAHRPRQKGKRK